MAMPHPPKKSGIAVAIIVKPEKKVFNFNTLTARDVILRSYFSFLYAEDVYIRLSAKFDFDRFSVWYNRRIFSYENS